MKWMTLRSESETVFVDSSSMSGLHATGRFGGRVDGGMRATPSRYPRSSGSASLVAALLGPIREIFPISLYRYSISRQSRARRLGPERATCLTTQGSVGYRDRDRVQPSTSRPRACRLLLHVSCVTRVPYA